MIHPHTKLAFISDEVGYGVVATSLLKKGTITWILDKLDREFTPQQVDKLDTIYKDILEKYSYKNNKGNDVLCWDNARFVNHSFKSNCLTTAYDFEIAIRDIQPGEQLTDDYGYLNVSEPFRGIDEGTKRKVVYPDDVLKYAKNWDKLLINALKRTPKVPQALSPLISRELWQKIDNINTGKEVMQSIATCYFKQTK